MSTTVDSVFRAGPAGHEARLRAPERARRPLPTIGTRPGVAGATARVIALIR
ncbi:hypothetical protein ACFYPK_08365 [Streptomyces halstedii]|uniref:hypothetical protein n=1 Tax=Streptomyces halstedii TaxID=1944 RepID=UPI00367ABFCA